MWMAKDRRDRLTNALALLSLKLVLKDEVAVDRTAALQNFNTCATKVIFRPPGTRASAPVSQCQTTL